MGAVHFSLDEQLLKRLKPAALEVFVETGTFEGETVAMARTYFQDIYSVELSSTYFAAAKARFSAWPHIHLVQGESPRMLTDLKSHLQDRAVLYFLDAHWCVATHTAGETSQCPLLAELAAIASLNTRSLIIIDDARLFLATPPEPHEVSHWPTLPDILKALQALSDQHRVMVVNDYIIFYPLALSILIQDYAKWQGIDWLHTYLKSKHYDNLLAQLLEKESVIQQLKARLSQNTPSLLKRIYKKIVR